MRLRNPILTAMVAAVLLASIALASSEPADAVLSTQNGRIAFSAGNSKMNSQIYTIRSDGFGLKRITKNAWDDYHPSYSPDGDRLAFDSYRKRQQIYVKNANDSGPATRLTGPVGQSRFPDWSPDGRKIVFGTTRNGIDDIWVMKDDGTQESNISKSASIDDAPSWSPDGERVAFLGFRDGDSEIFVIEADGTDLRQLTHNTVSDGVPEWSPDGTRLVFDRYLGAEDKHEIFTMKADGTGEHRLSFNHDDDQYPAWSPDGNRIAFTSTGDIWTMNIDGTAKRNVTRSPDLFESSPDWQPVG